MIKLISGLDEIGTETQKAEGWCYFCIPETDYLKLEAEVKSLLSGSTKLTLFHGKKFKANQSNEYEQFLRIIRRYAENSVPTILSCTLNSENWKQTFLEFCDRVTTNVFTQVGVTNQDLIKVCKQLTPGLFSFMRLINHFGKEYELSVEVDSDRTKENYPKLDTIIKGHKFTADFLMTRLYNAYMKLKFANSPQLSASGISVLKDQHSIAIQAADVIGNFSTSYVYYKLGNTSKTRILKGQIFEKVFGDKFDLDEFIKSVKLVGKNDLELLIEGAFTMTFTTYNE
ncbi:MAG: hypothetical protein Q8N83_15280 [Ignavibacteria bacterium]|nr:hypothetical protein [Ignavibacteria bacterium]